MRRLAMVGLLLAAAGCSDQLTVENVNNPDAVRALARPTDVENLVQGQYRIIHNAMWTTGGIQPQLGTGGIESFSGNANFGMGARGGVPRSLVDNSRGNATDYYATYLSLAQAARTEALTLSRLNDPAFTFFPTSAAQTERARAFAYFCKGVALGYMALMFDSAAVIDPADDLEANNPLVSYDSLMKYAIADLDSAVAHASLTPTGSNGFPLPATWIPSATSWTGGAAGNFVRLIRTHRARFRAGVARTPAERAAVDWALVDADAQNGVTADVSLTMSNVTGGWFYSPMQMSTYQSWHQMWQHVVGMADTSGSYDIWLNQTRQNKQPFEVVTNDSRFPSGATRTAQNASSGCTTGATCVPPAGQYFRNRLAGNDVAVDGLYHSHYDYHRFQVYYNANANGAIPFFPVGEMNMLRAEAAIRAGQFATAVGLINTSRAAHGLPNLPAIASLNDLITGPGCVPRVPVGATNQTNATPTATACGNIMEAMKWEKRNDIAFLSSGGWYFENRGWGDLPFNSPLHFPVPYRELDARTQTIYSIPTVNPAAGTYSAAERLSNSAPSYGIGQP